VSIVSIAQSINIRLTQVEGILDETDIVRTSGALGLDNFDNVETKMNPRIAQEAKIIQRPPAQVALLLAIHCFARRAELLRLAGLDLDEHKPVLVARDNVDFRLAAAEIAEQDLVAAPAQVFGGGFLTARAGDLPRRAVVLLSLEPAEEQSTRFPPNACDCSRKARRNSSAYRGAAH
jgi:hypothetical protein